MSVKSALTTCLLIILHNAFFNCVVNCSVDLDISTFDMIEKEGYPAEEHEIVTEDGYILSVQRIPGAKESTPVLLHHGFLSSSFDWIVTGRNQALAFILANARGTTYSRRHKHFGASDLRFWNFSWHEIGLYDLPAVITYITDLREERLMFIGHSMGTSVFYVMAIERPDVGSKVRAMSTLAEHLTSLIDRLEIGELLPQSALIRFIGHYGCGINLSASNACVQLMFATAGEDAAQFNYTLLPLILRHALAGSSVKTLRHYMQLSKTGRFQRFDYGPAGNSRVYSSYEPTDYNVSDVPMFRCSDVRRT